MPIVPRIRQVRTGEDYVLHVTFENGVTKLYDIKSRLNHERFSVLRDKRLFKSVQIDSGGFGVSWNDDVDLSEHELWTEGKDFN